MNAGLVYASGRSQLLTNLFEDTCRGSVVAFIHSLEGEHVHALRSRERGCFLVVQTLWAEKIQSTTDAGSLNTFGRTEIEVAPISSALLRIACLVILYKTCRELAADGVSGLACGLTTVGIRHRPCGRHLQD